MLLQNGTMVVALSGNAEAAPMLSCLMLSRSRMGNAPCLDGIVDELLVATIGAYVSLKRFTIFFLCFSEILGY